MHKNTGKQTSLEEGNTGQSEKKTKKGHGEADTNHACM